MATKPPKARFRSGLSVVGYPERLVTAITRG
jgi:hypothetical protein